MKKRWIAIFFILLILPYLVVMLLGQLGYFEAEPTPTPEEPQGFTVCLYRHEAEELVTLELRDYLWGVLAGEMPASYPAEALKAQVVASYSYLLHRMDTVAAHPATDFGHDGDVCDNPDHCKAYLSPAEASARWGEDWLEASAAHLSEAVEAVLGEALLYEGKPANAVFHAISGGFTEDAADVWGAKIAYLRSVDSHWDAEAEGFASEVRIPMDELRLLTGQSDCTLGAITLTEGGSVATLVIGEKSFTGRELRSLFGLRSTRFTLTFDGDEAIFTVSGYGHQVGMSQYGASVLAKNGYNYRQILAYYYQGTELTENYFSVA